MASPPLVNSLVDLLEHRASVLDGTVAIESERAAPVSYAALGSAVRGVADDLARLGGARAHRVAVVMANGPEMAVTCLALAAVATCVPLNPAYTEAELRGLMKRLGVTLVVVADEHGAAMQAARSLTVPVVGLRRGGGWEDFGLDVEPARAQRTAPVATDDLLHPAPQDTALVLHTSGSTAEPKIVPLSHRNLLASAHNVARSLRLGPEDVCLSAMPLFHIGALVDLLIAPLSVGGRVVLTSDMGATGFFMHLRRSRPTWYQGVPTMLQDILHRAETDLVESEGHELRFIRSVSAPLPPQVLGRVEECFGVPVIEIYGMTETAGLITSNPMPPGERRPGSVGLPAGPEVTVVDGAGNTAAPGGKGEVMVRGVNVMSGYETSAATAGEHFVDDWLRTGDEGYLDDDGYLYLTGRIKEIINRGGEKIAPREIDEVALDHPLVLEAAAFAVPHETLGEDVAIAIVPAPGVEIAPDDLRAFCGERLAHFKVPREIHVCAALPRAPGGKLQRRKLLAWCARDRVEADGPEQVAPPATLRQRLLVAVWEEALGVSPIGVHDDFVDLGGDSLRAVDLAIRMSECLGVEVPTALLYDSPTIAEVDAALDTLEPAGSSVPACDPVSAMLREVRGLVSTWDGRRLSQDSLLVGRNTLGGRPPLFWGVQGVDDLRGLSERLGPEQPVWGMRSLYQTKSKSPENIVALAGAYRAEVEAIQPQGPLRLGGYCAGGGVALEVARRFREEGRAVESLSLFEHFPSDTYSGPVAYFFAVESGWHPFKSRNDEWRRYCTGPVTLHPSTAEHVDIFFDDGAVDALARTLSEADRVSAGGADNGQLDVELRADLPRLLVSRARRSLTVELANTGAEPWPGGTTVFGRWGRPRSPRMLFDGSCTLEAALEPGGRVSLQLPVRAPLAPGPWRHTLQVVYGGDWNSGHIITPHRSLVTVLPGSAVLSYLGERLPRPSGWVLALRRTTGRSA